MFKELESRIATRRLILKSGVGFAASRLLPGATRYIESSVIDTAPMPGLGLSKWRYGALLNVDKSETNAATFRAAGSNGSILSEFKFSLPNVTRIWVNDFDRNASGTVVFCGGYYASEGQLSPFIAVRSPQDAEISVIRTFPYDSHLLTVAPDGTIYTVGVESLNGKHSGKGVNPNGDVIRHFNQSGSLIESTLPRLELREQPFRTVNGHLIATSNRVGWYSPIDGEGVYVELATNLQSQKKYAGLPSTLGPGTVLGFALTESGKVYSTWTSHNGGSARPIYSFDRSANVWTQISVSTSNGDHSLMLRGEEDGQLVFQGQKAMHFVTPSNA